MNCKIHDEREAVAGCVSCGNLICADCDVLIAGKHHCKQCLAEAGPATYPAVPTRVDPPPAPRARLLRSRRDSVVGGVCGGFAKYSGLDPAIVRIITVIAFLTCVSIFFYVLAWIVIPLEPEIEMA